VIERAVARQDRLSEPRIVTVFCCAVANVVTLFVALYLQITEGVRHVQLSLTLSENEMREAELLHEQEQMKAE